MVIVTTPPAVSEADSATICKSTNELDDVQNKLYKCGNGMEHQRVKNFIEDTTKPREDFEQMNAIYNDLMLSGDSLFGTQPSQTVLQQIKERNAELLKQKKSLEDNIQKQQAIIERTDRDFLDASKATPKPLADKTIHVLDDYTLVVLVVSYVFFALTCAFWYMQQNYFTPKSIAYALIGGVTISAFLLVIAHKFL